MDNNELNKNKLLKAKKALLTFGVAGVMVGGYCLGSKNIKPSDNVKIYREKAPTLDTPENVSLNDDYVAKWNKVKYADNYDIKIRYNNGGKISTYEPIHIDKHTSFGVVSCDLKPYVLYGYNKSKLYGKDVDVSVSVCAYAYSSNKNYEDSSYSEYSNEVSYYGEEPKVLDTPQNVTLSDKYIATWDEVEDADCYDVMIKYDNDGKIKTYKPIFTYEKNLFGKVYCDLKDEVYKGYERFDLYGKDVNVSIAVRAGVYIANGKNYVDSPYSSYSDELEYADSSNRVLVKSK